MPSSSASNLVEGFSLVLLAAVMNGAYAIPMKFLSRWRWENIWLIWTILSLWILPLAIAFIALPHPIDAYSQTPWSSFVTMGLLGLVWGLGVMLLGMSFPLVGVAVGTAIGLGCAAAVGALLPMMYTHGPGLSGLKATLFAAGILTLLLGVGICGIAGRLRERTQGIEIAVQGGSIRGILLAGIGGTLTASLNLALTTGHTISQAVQQQHTSNPLSGIAVWIPVLLTGGVPGVLYASTLIARNRSGGLFKIKESSFYLPLILMMSLLWLGSIVVYGVGVTDIGAIGSVIAWPAFMSGAVIAGTFWGTIFGEWKNSGTKSRMAMAAGILCLVVAMSLLERAGR